MPIHWRRFYFQKLVEFKTKEKEEMDKVNRKGAAKPPKVKFR